MRSRQVKLLLFLAILIMTVLPMLAALYFLDRSLQTSLDLGFNPQIERVLENESNNLKMLRDLDPANRDRYRTQFETVEELRQVYGDRSLVKAGIRKSLMLYFGIGLIAAVLLSVALAALLSRRIAVAYRTNYEELSRQRDRVRHLEEMSSWQELAKMLAHEIKNPLTPIEVLVTSLSKAYLAKPSEEFRSQLEQTKAMINEELAHLKNTVNKFSEFARLPAVVLAEENLLALLEQHVNAVGAFFDNAHIAIQPSERNVRVRVDSTLLRQALANLIRNGVEANPNVVVNFIIGVTVRDRSAVISIGNDGAPVPAHVAPRMFDLYVSGKAGKDNMGLGLAIVRKIVIEHGGDIEYREIDSKPTFAITLPILA
jgi:signal transduction histidine kinase